MADYELIQERLISGKGVLKIPGDKKKLRHYVLYSDVIRMPRNAYINKNWNPDKGKYAFITFVRNDYIIAEMAIEYKRQSIDGIADISGQTLIAVKCAYEGMLTTFANLGTALGAPPISYQDLIKDYENLNLVWDEIRVACYADTALQLRLYKRNYDTCNPDKDKQPPPPPPPPPLPPVPPGTPIGDISRPYDPSTNDSGNSSPYPGDELESPYPSEECVSYIVGYRIFSVFGGGATQRDFQTTLRGKIKDIRTQQRVGGLFTDILCGGRPNETCIQDTWVNIYQTDIILNPQPPSVILSVTPVT